MITINHEFGPFAALFNAYMSAEYRVYGDDPFSMHVGTISAEIKRLFQKNSITDAVFITAYNPRSKRLTYEENEARLLQMEQEIKSMGFEVIKGVGLGQDSDAGWSERSLLVLGMEKSTADDVSRRYEQNAYVLIESDCIPKLIADFGVEDQVC